MSEPTVTARPRTPAKGSSGKILGMKPLTAAIVGGAVLLVGIGIYLYKQHQAAAAASTADTDTNGDCTDSQGNTVPCPGENSTDDSGELSVLQTELESVLANQAASTGTTTTSTSTSSTGNGLVPNLMGLQSVAASNEAKTYGFKVKFSGKGTVVSQTPGPGTQAVKGSTIDLGRQEISAAEAKQVRAKGAAMGKKAES